jgi:thiol-disulfide isomerase/thioredoxin
VKLEDFAGRPVVINIWASWCESCVQEAPELASFAQRHPRLAILGVDTTDSDDAGRDFARQHGYAFPSIVDAGGQIGQQLGVDGLPTMLFLDGQHRVVQRINGAANPGQFDSTLATAGLPG